MFLTVKVDANVVFEKLKQGLLLMSVERTERNLMRTIYPPTASLESIFNEVKIIVDEGQYKLILDVGGAYLNAAIDRDIYMWLDPAVVRILISITPNEYERYKDAKGRILVKLNKAL